MEDGEMLAADCIVICCCCQCLLLQIFVFILLKLPQKLLRKTKAYAKKLTARRRAASAKVIQIEMTGYEQDSFRSLGNSFRIDIRDLFLVESLQFCSMNEVERVLEEVSSRGEFAFGSFWGGEEEVSASQRLQSCPVEIDYDCIGFRLMELFGSSANFS